MARQQIAMEILRVLRTEHWSNIVALLVVAPLAEIDWYVAVVELF